MRRVGPLIEGKSAPYMMWSRNKRGITLNLKSAEDQATLLELLPNKLSETPGSVFFAAPMLCEDNESIGRKVEIGRRPADAQMTKKG